jgi:crotonobetainyl-CoA:carnitine CoA-transferase CaiB-like acyl-CoA transferase
VQRVQQLPLAGVTVVEFATIIAAPLGTSLLADMGARVIKVEPLDGDPFRAMLGGVGAARVNAGKESICVDLKTTEGQRVARRLIACADVLVHNYRSGVPERLGIGYADACGVNPRIVYVSVNGYGPRGPGALRPSTHPIPGAALGGVVAQLGGRLPEALLHGAALRDAARRIARANELNPDPNTSVVVATAVTLGLAAVARCGVGQPVYVDMFGANAYANFDDYVDFPGRSARPLPDPDGYGLSRYQRLYRGADGWFFVSASAGERERFDALCASFTRADESLEVMFARESADGWIERLRGEGIACVRADAGLPAELIAAEGLVVEAHSSAWGAYQRHAPLLEFDAAGKARGWCAMGEHTRALLEEFDR